MFKHDYDVKPLELLPLREQLKKAGLLETELQKTEQERLSIEEIKEIIALQKQKENKYYRFKSGALNYFNKHRAVYKWLSRKQLREIDGGLYFALRKEGTLTIAIPRTIRRDFSKIDPIQYFKKHHAEHCKNVTDLFKRDQTLYAVLHKSGELGDLLDKEEYADYKNNPLEIFRAYPEYHDLSRTQLSKINRRLYRALHYYGQIDEAIPIKQDNNFKKDSN